MATVKCCNENKCLEEGKVMSSSRTHGELWPESALSAELGRWAFLGMCATRPDNCHSESEKWTASVYL